MYEPKQMPLKERTGSVSHRVNRENRAGIPAAAKTEYEGAGGLAFDDVKIYYHPQKPGRLQASVYAWGNRACAARRQGRTLLRDPAPVIQGVFLRWVSDEEGSQSYLEEVKDGGYHDHDTVRMSATELFDLLKDIRDPALIGKVSREISSRLHSMKMSDVLNLLRSLCDPTAEEGITVRIVNALDHSFCNWLWHMAKRICMTAESAAEPSKYTKEDISAAERVKTLVESRFSPSPADREGSLEDGRLGAGVTDAQRYGEVLWNIDRLHRMIDQVRGMPDSDKKKQLIELIRYDILGYMRLRKRFSGDFMMKQMPLEALQGHFLTAFSIADADAAFLTEMIASVEPAAESSGLPIMYADEKSRQVPLPAKAEFQTAIRNEEPVPRSGPEVTAELAKGILEEAGKAGSGERLVIFRGMNSTEALSILQIFNTPAAAALEKAVREHSIAHPFDPHKVENRAKLGKHYGEYAQAEEYRDIRDGKANVLLAFILKPGAKRLLFSKSLLALPPEQRQNGPQQRGPQQSMSLRSGHEGFAEASASEGTAPGYIGMKAEQAEGKSTYSLGVAQPLGEGARTSSQLLLQLLIDRVEVRRILF